MAALVRSSSWVTNWGQPKGHQECLQRGIFFCQQSVTRVCSLKAQIYVHHEEAADQLPVDIIKPSNFFTVCQPNVSLSLSQQRFDWSLDCRKKKLQRKWKCHVRRQSNDPDPVLLLIVLSKKFLMIPITLKSFIHKHRQRLHGQRDLVLAHLTKRCTFSLKNLSLGCP